MLARIRMRIDELQATTIRHDRASDRRNDPLELQLGKAPVYLVTNVLDPKELTNTDACRLYQLRWGIELGFRTLRQTFGRGKLRSRTPDRALRELDWSLLGLWMIQLFAVKEKIKIGEAAERSSAAAAIRVIREVMHDRNQIPIRSESLPKRLRRAVTDKYDRTKAPKRACYRPYNKKDTPAAGKPNIHIADESHKKRLCKYLASAL